MFDIAFTEILVIAVVALIVIGPEKLPKVARTLGMLTGRVQRYVSSVRADIEREMRMEDLRALQEETRQSILNTESQAASEAQKLEHAIETALEPSPTLEPSIDAKPQDKA